MIWKNSQSQSEEGRDNKFYLSKEVQPTLLLGMALSFECCDWLIKKRKVYALQVAMGSVRTGKCAIMTIIVYFN